jgi:DNA-directed RNA polymerase subunit K/omega
MAIQTTDIDGFMSQTSSIYESVVVMSKRARQISSNEKAELDNKLSYYEGFGPEMEDTQMAAEQARVSIEFEKKPKPTEMAIGEMQEHEIYFRYTEEDDSF